MGVVNEGALLKAAEPDPRAKAYVAIVATPDGGSAFQDGSLDLEARVVAQTLPPLGVAQLSERVAARLAKRPARAVTVRTIVRSRRAAGIQVAIATLGHWDEPENVEILLAMVRDRGCASELKDFALQALCAMEAPEALDDMCKALTGETVDSGTRCRCADAAAAIGNWGALPALEAAAQANARSTLGAVALEAMVAIRSGVDVSCP